MTRLVHCALRLPVLVFTAILVGTMASRASDEATVPDTVLKPALQSSLAWIAEIDAGKFDQSYAEGCVAFHNKVSHEQWMTILKALRTPQGTVVSRKVLTTSYKADGYEGLEGECMVIRYKTVFSKVADDLEQVVMKREDGVWRGAGYISQPQGDQSDNDVPPAPDAHTEIQQEQVK